MKKIQVQIEKKNDNGHAKKQRPKRLDIAEAALGTAARNSGDYLQAAVKLIESAHLKKLETKLSKGRVAKDRLGDAASILFDEIYQDIREKSFDEAVCLFEAVLGLTRYNPEMEFANTAMQLISYGAARLDCCRLVQRSRALNALPK